MNLGRAVPLSADGADCADEQAEKSWFAPGRILTRRVQGQSDPSPGLSAPSASSADEAALSRMKRRAWLCLMASALAGCAIGGSGGGPMLLGLDGREQLLMKVQGARGLVLVFVSVDCPIANRFLPEIESLGARFGPEGLPVAYVYASPFESDTQVGMHRREYGLLLPAFRDPGFRVARRFGACRTPEAVLIRPDGSVAYRGRINDQYTAPGQGRPAPTRHDLAEAAAEFLSGGLMTQRLVPAVGCRFRDPGN